MTTYVDLFAEYTIGRSLLNRLIPIGPGDKVIVANRYIAPDPFVVVVERLIAGDLYTDPKIITTNGDTYPFSICYPF